MRFTRKWEAVKVISELHRYKNYQTPPKKKSKVDERGARGTEKGKGRKVTLDIKM